METINVVILQHRLLHYRVQFFEKLKQLCELNSIQLHVVHGQSAISEKTRKDEGYLKWANNVKNTYIKIGGTEICFQPIPKHLRNADLIIMMQENRIITNYLLIILRRFSNYKLAFWGHGANFQAKNKNSIREKWKRKFIHKVDWWFAYTKMTVEILENEKFSEKKISCLNNAIDNIKFKEELECVSEQELLALRDEIGIKQESKICLFCGSLYSDKRLDILLGASEIIKEKYQNYELIVIGDGPDRKLIENAGKKYEWIHYLGVKTGREKALLYKLSHAILNPGLVGLHVLDSFCAGIPMITTNNARHSPEIVYMQHGYNGIICGPSFKEYASCVINLLGDENYYNRLSQGAKDSAQLYTQENMLNNFMDGINKCLKIE